jgi:endonuclease I
MRKNFTLLFLYFFLFTFASAPAGYYNSANEKNTSALRTALQSIISNGYTQLTYTPGLWNAYQTTDINSSGKIWDMYSNCTFTVSANQCGSYSKECDCYNREHTTPASWFNDAYPMYSDLFNVYPTDGYVNNQRSNFPYGEVGSATYTSANGSKLGTSNFSGYSGTVFEPIDEYKGDFARNYFYMATRYAGLCESWTGGSGAVVYSSANLGLTSYAVSLFLKWSREDPVSAKEMTRNDAVYSIQNNRNPFIDFPGLEEYIWGNKTTALFYTDGTATPYLTSPSANTTLAFGNVAYQHTGSATILIKGINLTGNLTLALSGTSASKFSLPLTTITQAQATAGYELSIGYNASVIETSSAILTISGGGLSGQVQVNLSATATDDFMALAATNIGAKAFTANWTSSAAATGYTLDVYKMTGTGTVAQTIIEEDFNSGISTGWTTGGYTETQTSSNVRMASGSNFGSVTTPALSLAQPSVVTVKSKQYGSDAGAKLWVIAGTSDTITSFVNSDAYQTFTYNIPAKASTTLTFYAMKSKRIYLDYVKLTTEGSTQTPESLSGYPKSVGNVLSYAVSELSPSTTYYYNVTPEGNSTGKSASITVQTTVDTGNAELTGNRIYSYSTAEGIVINNLPENCEVTVMNVLGRTLQVLRPTDNKTEIKTDKGLYILRIKFGNETCVLKAYK